MNPPKNPNSKELALEKNLRENLRKRKRQKISRKDTLEVDHSSKRINDKSKIKKL